MLKRVFKRLLARSGYAINKRSRYLAEKCTELQFDETYILAHLFAKFPDPFIVQVGAFDGVANDPLNQYIRRYRLAGLLIEPQASAFARLVSNYSQQSRLAFSQVAVADRNGICSLYTIDPAVPGLPEWAPQTATFVKDVLRRHETVIADLEAHIIAEAVPCRTFQSLFSEFNIKNVDILQIDVEGYDYEILKMFPFERFWPILVRYEHVHLCKTDREACMQMLSARGYSLFSLNSAVDTVAYRPNAVEIVNQF